MSVLNFSYPIYTSSEYKFCTSFIKLFPNYFVLFDAAIKRIFLTFFFRLFIASVQKYNCFFMLTLQPATWLNSFISSNRVLVDASECSVQNMMPSGSITLLISFFKKKKFTWLHCVLVTAQGIFNYGMRTLSCSMRTLSYGIVGSSSLTKDQTWAPCIGSVASQPLDHQESPYLFLPNLGAFFFSFSCLITVARTSNRMLNGSRENRRPSLFLIIVKTFTHLSLSKISAMGPRDALCQAILQSQFVKYFYH